MQRRPTVTRRALLSTAAGCFGGSLLLDSWLFDSAAASTDVSTWRQRWGDGTQRKFTPARPDPASLTESWSTTPGNLRGNLTVECVDSDRVYVRGYNQLAAYDRADGSRQWTYASQEGSFARPTLVDETLVVQENARVHAVGAESGRARWRGSFSAPSQPFSNPTARDGGVYLPGEESYTMVAPRTGFQQGAVDAGLLGTLVAATESALFWWNDGTLRMTDAEGDIQWRRTFGRSFPPGSETIAVTEGCVVLRRFSTGEDQLVTALDPENGDRLWEVREAFGDGIAVAAGPQTVYLSSGSRLVAFDATTGERRWSLSTSAVGSAPVVTPETVFVPVADGVAPVDPESGDQQADVAFAGRSVTSLAAVDDALYATAGNRVLAWGEA